MKQQKKDVYRWETVTTYIATFPNGNDPDGACDVEVQIGEAGGTWYVRTRDDAGGCDSAEDTAHRTRAEAETTARAFALANDEGEGDDDCAADYLARVLDRSTL